MERLKLHELHQSLNASFVEVNGVEGVQSYGDLNAEYLALQESAVVMDLSHRSRVCLTGADRARFLNGQVTNNIKQLQPGQGCYAALVNAKGKMESDLHVHCLKDELLLDFEPGLTSKVVARLEKYIVADNVEVVDLRPHFGHLGIQGPRATEVIQRLGLKLQIPQGLYASISVQESAFGELLLVNLPRCGGQGFDCFVANEALGTMMDRLLVAARAVGGCVAGGEVMEIQRIEAGVPCYGQDMNENNIPLEAGLEERAIRYDKGCYIGQEVINRVHSIGQVTRSLRGLLLPDELSELPGPGQKLWHQGKEVGYVTSSVKSPRFRRNIALGYVRKEVKKEGTRLELGAGAGLAKVLSLPFSADQF